MGNRLIRLYSPNGGQSSLNGEARQKMFRKFFLVIILSSTLLILYGCGEGTKPDPKDTGTGQNNPTQVNPKEKEVIDEETLKAMMKYGLHEAAKVGDLQAVQAFIDAGAPLEEYDEFLGQTPLMFASKQGHHTVAEALLKAGVNPDKLSTIMRNTALHMAAFNNQVEVAKVLLKWKANPNIKDRRGDTPLHEAASEGHGEVVTVLLAAPNIDTTITNEDGETARDVAKDDSIRNLFPTPNPQ